MNPLEQCKKVKANVSQKGRTYQVGSILALIVVGYMYNVNSVAGISRFGRRLVRSQQRRVGFTKGRSPCHSTILETLNRIDVLDLEKIICKGSGAAEKSKVIDIDGKTTVSAQELLKINRDRWSVENRIHWVRDVVFREDSCTVHKRIAAQVLTALRNVVVACIKKTCYGFTATREKLAHRHRLAFKLLLFDPG